jgi:hypothetical protein
MIRNIGGFGEIVDEDNEKVMQRLKVGALPYHTVALHRKSDSI